MASHHAIGAITRTLVGLLRDARSTLKITDNVNDVQVEAYQAKDFAKPMTQGVSLYLYRVLVSTSRRNLPARLAPDGRRYRPSLPLDLHYMLTPWGSTADMQHQILGWAMRTVEDTPTLSSAYLNSFDPEHEPFGADETVDMVFDPVSLQDLSYIWEVNKPVLQVSVTYVARVVPIDSLVLLPDTGKLVQARR